MKGPADDRERAEELLLARISATAGRAHLGRRRVTYRAPSTEPRRRRPATVRMRRLLRAGRGPAGSPGARLDLYEHGLTVAFGRRIHAVRFDTTVVRRCTVLTSRGVTGALVLVDVHGERVVLRRGDFARPQEWWSAICGAVVAAQAPRALAALRQGARLAFGSLWVTADAVGSARTSLRWTEVRRIEVRNGFVTVRADGRRLVWASAASGIPNLCVFRSLAEHLARAGRDDD
ncbi:DUF6585 family protein [Streptomyces lavenduligriseus]|uniref:PE-PGRS family protein n=1 Tax=Streptomyces lavenduligriseus TaxID=67315 RepID=A0ABT0P3G6_9ACTN|nr:DUF6585 family protein [Streptomyces lavenduligriseus]MCL3998259.1 hypothetical protein [Streptomyces lavenduligriseus]